MPLLVFLASLLLLPALAVGQNYRFPTSPEDYQFFYPTNYYAHTGLPNCGSCSTDWTCDWNCGCKSKPGHKGNDFGIGSWQGMAAGRDVVAAAGGNLQRRYQLTNTRRLT